MHNNIRQPAVAGMFYPAAADELTVMVEGFLQQAETARQPPPKAIIAPHAGYIYSGPVAASAYAQLKPVRDIIKRVVLLGPSHRVPLIGLAATQAEQFLTPLGSISIDQSAIESVLDLPQVKRFDAAHAMEHSLEVHLPFLQIVLTEFSLAPFVVGEATPREVGEVLQRLWGGEETLIVISSDLSHYEDYSGAQHHDRKTSQAIEHLDYRHIEYEDACGRNPVNGLLYLAEQKGLTVTTLDLRNSGDTAGPRDQVVGYGAYALNETQH